MNTFNCPKCSAPIAVFAEDKVPKRGPSPVQPGNLNQQVKALLQEIYDGVMMGTVLDSASEGFIEKTKNRLEDCEQRGWEIRMSEKQMAYLRSLAKKAGVD